MVYLLVALLAIATPEADLTLPARVEAKVAEPVKITAMTTAKAVTWIVIDRQRAAVIPPEDMKSTTFLWLVPRGGDIRIVAVCVGANGEIQQAETLVVVGGQPGPGPGPQPIDLRKKLQDAFDADVAPTHLKAQQKINLIGLYQAMAETTPTAKQITTTEQLKALLAKTATAMLKDVDAAHPGGVLTPVRKVIATEVATAVGTGAVLTDEVRAKVTALFAQVALELKEVK